MDRQPTQGIEPEAGEVVWRKLGYFEACHLCVGLWGGWGLALLIPELLRQLLSSNPLLGAVLDGIAYKVIGHKVLEWTAAKASSTALNSAQCEQITSQCELLESLASRQEE